MDKKTKKFVFTDGKFIPENEAKISIASHALNYGTGCFEGIRGYYSQKEKALFVFRLESHYRRLLNSGKILFMDIPYSVKELCDFTIQLLKKNFEPTDTYIRPLLFKSDLTVGNFNLKTLKTSIAIYTVALGRYLDTEKGIKANISSWRRTSDNAIPARAKITGSYVNTALAKTESALNGFDEAIFLDQEGHITEGSGENLFMVKNNVVITPPENSDILVGITRSTVINLLKDDLEVEITERAIDRTEIYQADEVFLVGTGAEITPIIEIDKRKIGNGRIGNITKDIKDLYHNIVHGENKKYLELLTKVTLMSF